ncbi:MAG: hypothetical protein LRY55_07730 [Leadbetterella sp.]|nr:hypothetical protein [Leadbetterella sp.]
MLVFVLNFLLNISFGASHCKTQIQLKDDQGNPLQEVAVIAGNRLLGYTDEQGRLELSLPEGKHLLMFSGDWARRVERDVVVKCGAEITVVLSEDEAWTINLEEVKVKSVTAKEVIDRSPFTVQAIDLRKEYQKGGDVSEVLNRASGIKLRTDGNIGSAVQINLGGLQGKAVKLFKDGSRYELIRPMALV